MILNHGVLQMTSSTKIKEIGRRLDSVSRVLDSKGLSEWAKDYWGMVYTRLLRDFHDMEGVPFKEREK